MNSVDYKNKSDSLFKKWKKAHPEYTEGKNKFTEDGIINFDLWKESTPKILLLLKENYDQSEEGWNPKDGIKVGNKFSKNIALWCQLIRELYNNSTKEILYSTISSNLPESVNDIAIVEIKKLNENKTTSSYYDILKYAEQDKEFLKEQIELINPQIILCCGDITFKSYEKIYNIEKRPQPDGNYFDIDEKFDSSFWIENNKLIINFYHPSLRRSSENAYLLLYKLIKEGNMFKKYKQSFQI